MAGILVVFDFDRTIIDGDSDSWVVKEMGMTELFSKLRSTMPWNSLMNRMMMEIHSQGKTTSDIANCLKRAPIHPSIIGAIKSAHALGCDLRIISDANKFFIEAILEHHGVLGCFSQIATNPAFVDEKGRLRILPYHDLSSPHSCSLCPPNLCKGRVLYEIKSLAPENERKRIIYLGDGGGDYCPTLGLSKEDHVMPRENYPLWRRINSDRSRIMAKVHEWSDGDELKKILLYLISAISVEAIDSSNGITLEHI